MKGCQRGAAVLAAVLAIVSLALLLTLYARCGAQSQLQTQRSAVDQLAVAKQALLDYSINYPSHYAATGSGPGHLPCPDSSGNGSPQPSCGPTPIGLLPVDFEAGGRKNISFYQAQSRADQPIWYVLSSRFRYSPAPSGRLNAATIVNSDTVGELQLDDESGLIALLIDPGPPLAGQNRSTGLNIADFLEGENGDGDGVFSSRVGNDRFLALRWSDLMPLVERRVLAAVSEVLQAYRSEHGYWPWLAPSELPLQGERSVCEPCNWRGWLGSDSYQRGGPWPVFSRQLCEQGATLVDQPTPELPGWLVRNYWHRFVWLHLRGDSRAGRCAEQESPHFEGVAVAAVLASVGAPLRDPAHGLGSQSRQSSTELRHFFDSDIPANDKSNYRLERLSESMNDQWVALP